MTGSQRSIKNRIIDQPVATKCKKEYHKERNPSMAIAMATFSSCHGRCRPAKAASTDTPEPGSGTGRSPWRDLDQRRGVENLILSKAPSVPSASLSGLGLFLQDQYQTTDRLRLTAGIRYDHFILGTSPTPNFDPRAQSVIGANRSDDALSGNPVRFSNWFRGGW